MNFEGSRELRLRTIFACTLDYLISQMTIKNECQEVKTLFFVPFSNMIIFLFLDVTSPEDERGGNTRCTR